MAARLALEAGSSPVLGDSEGPEEPFKYRRRESCHFGGNEKILLLQGLPFEGVPGEGASGPSE